MITGKYLVTICILDHHSRMKWIFLYFFGQFLGLDGPYLALLGPLLASPASGLTPSTRGNPVSTRSRPIFDQKFFVTSEKSYLGVLPPKIDSYGLGTIIERSASKFCISGLRRRVKRSSWSNFMAMSIRFILQWRSRLHITYVYMYVCMHACMYVYNSMHISLLFFSKRSQTPTSSPQSVFIFPWLSCKKCQF